MGLFTMRPESEVNLPISLTIYLFKASTITPREIWVWNAQKGNSLKLKNPKIRSKALLNDLPILAEHFLETTGLFSESPATPLSLDPDENKKSMKVYAISRI